MNTLKVKDWIKDTKFPFQITKSCIGEGFKYHNHEFFEFFFVSEGKFSHTLNGEERVVGKGDIVLMNPGYKHSFKPLGEQAGFEQARSLGMHELVLTGPGDDGLVKALSDKFGTAAHAA